MAAPRGSRALRIPPNTVNIALLKDSKSPLRTGQLSQFDNDIPEEPMTAPRSRTFNRRTVLKGAAAAVALQAAPPFIIKARGETPLRIGLVDPLTGVYAAVAQNEVTGAKLAVQQINAKGGILGRPIELLVEDS